MTYKGRFSERAKKCHLYMRMVQLEARAAGLRTPLHAKEGAPVMIHTRCIFENRRHPDPENVQKLITDSLFYGAPGGDKHVGGSYGPPSYGDKPRVFVTVEIPE